MGETILGWVAPILGRFQFFGWVFVVVGWLLLGGGSGGFFFL